MFSLFSKRKKVGKHKEITLTEELQAYLDGRPEFRDVIPSEEGIQFCVGNNGRLFIYINLLDNKYHSHSLHGAGLYINSTVKVQDPYNLKQLMLAVYDSAIKHFSSYDNNTDILNSLYKAKRILLINKL